jgi:GTP-binding protein HflX
VESVNKILDEIQASDKPTLMVFNKIDLFSYVKKDEDDLTPRTRANNSLDDWEKTWMSKMNNNCIFISAHEKQNWNEFKTTVYDLVKEIHTRRYPYNKFLY